MAVKDPKGLGGKGGNSMALGGMLNFMDKQAAQKSLLAESNQLNNQKSHAVGCGSPRRVRRGQDRQG